MRAPDALGCLTGLFLFASIGLHGQAPAQLEFEVASVRPSAPLPPRGRGGLATITPERLTYQWATFERLLMDAYDVQRDQIKGPAWVTARAVDGAPLFDISAKVPPGATKEQVATMLQNLLKVRFKLAVHHERAEESSFALVVAKGGPRLKASAGPPRESERNPTEKGPVNLQMQKDGFPELFPGKNMGGTFTNGTARIRFRDYPLSDLVEQFSFALATRLIDKTGLTGRYDFTLEFTPPETGTNVGMLATLPLNPGQVAPLKGGPNPGQLDSLSTVSSAMERQLGLKLEATRIAIDTLVIDSVERTPTDN
ncbi:MAG: TIGR03435 family protein [Vicinamibacterales bacterium]